MIASSLKEYLDFRYILFFSLLLILLAIHYHIITAAIVLLCVWALMGPKQAIQALSVNYLIILLNYGIWDFPPGLGILRWLVLFAAALRVLPFASVKALHYLAPLCSLYFIVLVLSFAASPYFLLSVMKLTAFTLCAGTVLAAFACLGKNELADLKKWFFSMVGTVILFSLPMIAVPSIGYMRNGRGFQGILQHPQSFAVFLVPLSAYLGADFLMTARRKSISISLFCLLMLALLMMAKARTAAAALLLAVASAVFISTVFSRKVSFDWAPGKGATKAILISFLFTFLVALSPQVSAEIRGFIFKGSNAETVEEAFQKSRGKGAAFFWQRFTEKPWTGHGFGIDVAHGNEKKPETFMGVPIAAATEKGFLPAAFAEEVGVIGLLAFLPFILLLISGAVNSGAIALMAMFFGCLFVNVGEAVFFSPGYIGGFLWLLIGLGTARGWQQDHEF